MFLFDKSSFYSYLFFHFRLQKYNTYIHENYKKSRPLKNDALALPKLSLMDNLLTKNWKKKPEYINAKSIQGKMGYVDYK